MTWSHDFRSFLNDCANSDVEPWVKTIDPNRPYEHTYTVDAGRAGTLWEPAVEFAEHLREIDPPQGAVLLRGMLDDEVTRRGLHVGLALLRAAIAGLAGSDLAALHSRVGDVGGDVGEMRLHCDLYAPNMLLIVYDDVPEDGSGELLILSSKRFLELLHDCAVPWDLRERLSAFLRESADEDRFDAFYSALYEPLPWERWRQRLVDSMHDEARRLDLRRGDGVLLADRRWLHGRSRPSTGVSPWRLHRLAFATSEHA